MHVPEVLHRPGTLLAILSVAVAALAALYLAIYPGGVTVHCAGGECTEARSNLVQENGPIIVAVLLIPPAAAASGIAASLVRGLLGTVGLFVAAIFLIVFCVASLLSLGLFYAPAAFFLLTAALQRLYR